MIVILAALLIGPVDTMAEDLKITAFKGNWRGNAVSESDASVNFPITSRDIDVRITPKDGGDFEITWRTLLRQKGTPGNPEETLKETTISDAGDYDMQVYKRTLNGVNMELEFTALRDGAVRRTANGRLVLDSY